MKNSFYSVEDAFDSLATGLVQDDTTLLTDALEYIVENSSSGRDNFAEVILAHCSHEEIVMFWRTWIETGWSGRGGSYRDWFKAYTAYIIDSAPPEIQPKLAERLRILFPEVFTVDSILGNDSDSIVQFRFEDVVEFLSGEGTFVMSTERIAPIVPTTVSNRVH